MTTFVVCLVRRRRGRIIEVEDDLAAGVTYRAVNVTLRTSRKRKSLRCNWRRFSCIIGSQLKASTRSHVERRRDFLSPYGGTGNRVVR